MNRPDRQPDATVEIRFGTFSRTALTYAEARQSLHKYSIELFKLDDEPTGSAWFGCLQVAHGIGSFGSTADEARDRLAVVVRGKLERGEEIKARPADRSSDAHA